MSDNFLTPAQAREWCEHPIDFGRNKVMVAAFFAKMRASVPIFVSDIDRLTEERDDARAEIARLTASYNTLFAERAGVSEAMKLAKREIVILAESGVNRLRDFGHEVDDPERTYGPILANLEAALATPIPTPVDREAVRAEAEKSQGPSNLTAPSASIDRSAQETAPQATHAVISMNDLFGPGWSNGHAAGRAEAFEEAAKIADEAPMGAYRNPWVMGKQCHQAIAAAIRSAAKTGASR